MATKEASARCLGYRLGVAFGMMIISELLTIEPIANIISAAGGPAPVHRMRVQLQDDTNIKHAPHTYGIARTANATTGVTVLQIRHALMEMYQDVAMRAPWFPLRLRPQLVAAIIAMSQKLGHYPPAGIQRPGNIERATFVDHGTQYRVDLENLFGHNLRA